MKKNWKITTYNKQNKIIETWIIQDRTEKEAFNEAEADINQDSRVHDWTMVETKTVIRDVKFKS